MNCRGDQLLKTSVGSETAGGVAVVHALCVFVCCDPTYSPGRKNVTPF